MRSRNPRTALGVRGSRDLHGGGAGVGRGWGGNRSRVSVAGKLSAGIAQRGIIRENVNHSRGTARAVRRKRFYVRHSLAITRSRARARASASEQAAEPRLSSTSRCRKAREAAAVTAAAHLKLIELAGISSAFLISRSSRFVALADNAASASARGFQSDIGCLSLPLPRTVFLYFSRLISREKWIFNERTGSRSFEE